MPQSGKQGIVIHILPNISRTKGNQTIKLDKLIEYNMRRNFLKKSYTNCGGKNFKNFALYWKDRHFSIPRFDILINGNKKQKTPEKVIKKEIAYLTVLNLKTACLWTMNLELWILNKNTFYMYHQKWGCNISFVEKK